MAKYKLHISQYSPSLFHSLLLSVFPSLRSFFQWPASKLLSHSSSWLRMIEWATEKEVEHDNLKLTECNFDISGYNLLLSFKILIVSACMVITPQITACWNDCKSRTCGTCRTWDLKSHHCRDLGSWIFSLPGEKNTVDHTLRMSKQSQLPLYSGSGGNYFDLLC